MQNKEVWVRFKQMQVDIDLMRDNILLMLDKVKNLQQNFDDRMKEIEEHDKNNVINRQC